jgi:hypothetical protein
VTVGQIVSIPAIAQAPDAAKGAERFEFANPENLADEWREFESQGVGHVIVWPQPYNDACLELITAALGIYRAGSGE